MTRIIDQIADAGLATSYRGRFAPSPTGPLHFGSLVSALASFLDARAAGGSWIVRIEDIDPPREVPGAASAILRTLEACALHWDGAVEYQSRRTAHYATALATLRDRGLAYPCGCTRREITIATAANGAPPGREIIYPGTCRAGLRPGMAIRAWRMRVPDQVIGFDDRTQGRVEQFLPRDTGDFVLRRADGLFAYQLAVVVDDALQGITDVVRGADLLDSTPRQIALQAALGHATPRYRHVPVVVNAHGEKLSKQTRARALDPSEASRDLVRALAFLHQDPPPDAADGSAAEVVAWGITHWSPDRIPRTRGVPAK